MILGIDMGGTNTRLGLVNQEFQLEKPCHIIPSSSFCKKGRAVEKMKTIISEYLNKYGSSQIEGISIGVPASVCGDFQTIYCAPNLFDEEGNHIFENFNLADTLSELMGVPVLVNKDVNNLLYYDAAVNGLKGTVVACYIGTGVGGAVRIEERLLYGSHGFAMDIGHMPLFHGKRMCGCGKKGCAETVVSGVALKCLKEERFAQTAIGELFLYHKRDKKLQQFVKDCAHIPAVLTTIFNPDFLVLGGGIIEMQGFPREKLEIEIKREAGKAVASMEMKFIYADRLPERGVIGAAYFAEEYWKKKGDI